MRNLLFPLWKNVITTKMPLSDHEGIDGTTVKQKKLGYN